MCQWLKYSHATWLIPLLKVGSFDNDNGKFFPDIFVFHAFTEASSFQQYIGRKLDALLKTYSKRKLANYTKEAQHCILYILFCK